MPATTLEKKSEEPQTAEADSVGSCASRCLDLLSQFAQFTAKSEKEIENSIGSLINLLRGETFELSKRAIGQGESRIQKLLKTQELLFRVAGELSHGQSCVNGEFATELEQLNTFLDEEIWEVRKRWVEEMEPRMQMLKELLQWRLWREQSHAKRELDEEVERLSACLDDVRKRFATGTLQPTNLAGEQQKVAVTRTEYQEENSKIHGRSNEQSQELSEQGCSSREDSLKSEFRRFMQTFNSLFSAFEEFHEIDSSIHQACESTITHSGEHQTPGQS